MHAFGFAAHGEMDQLGFVEVPEPVPGPQEVRIRVRAAGFNRLDRFVLSGIPGVPVPLPHVLGSDAAGVVEQVGESVDDLPLGTRVLVNPGLSDGRCDACRAGRECFCRQFQIVGEHVQGSAAPYLVVPRRNVYPIPGGLDFVQAASFPLVFQTAWRALRTVGELQPGERVAVIGAGGGTTTAAIQVARASGARVAVVSRSAAKAARAQALGAETAIVLEEANPLDRALWTWSDKQGVDLIFDSVGGPTLPLSVKALARGGRVVVIGATADPKAMVDLRTLFWRQTSIRGSTMSTVHEFEEMLAAVERRTLVPVIDSKFPFDQAVDAFRRFASGDLFGKVVLELSEA